MTNGPVLAKFKLKTLNGHIVRNIREKISKTFTIVINTSVTILFELASLVNYALIFLLFRPNFEYPCLLRLTSAYMHYFRLL